MAAVADPLVTFLYGVAPLLQIDTTHRVRQCLLSGFSVLDLLRLSVVVLLDQLRYFSWVLIYWVCKLGDVRSAAPPSFSAGFLLFASSVFSGIRLRLSIRLCEEKS